MPCGLNTVVVAKAYNQNYKLGAAFALISSLAAIVTIPLILVII
jgi:predicted permease